MGEQSGGPEGKNERKQDEAKADREARLAAALRANLKRRKGAPAKADGGD